VEPLFSAEINFSRGPLGVESHTIRFCSTARARARALGPPPTSATPNLARGGNGERVDLNPDLAAEKLLDVSKDD